MSRQTAAYKGGDALESGGEAEGGREFQEEADGVVAEVRLHRVEGEDGLAAPVEQALFHGPFPERPEEHFAHEEGHRVFMEVAADAVQRMEGGEVPDGPERGFRILGHIAFQQVEGEEEGHGRLLADPHEETPPAMDPREGVEDQLVFPELRGVQDDKLGGGGHGR